MQQRLVNRAVLVVVLLAISGLFFSVIKPFILSIFLAALFAALFTPLYRRFLSLVGNREALASVLTLLTVLFFVFVPFLLVFSTVLGQAVDIAQTARPWIQEQLGTPGLITEKLEALPFYEQLLPYREMALTQLGELTSRLSNLALGGLQAITTGTLSALLSMLIILYTMFFFLIDGDRLLYYLLYYIPLNDDDETKLLHRFTSVTRATLKGTAVIGVLQGTLAGFALWVAGIPSVLFWAVAMMFLSVVPGVGTALIWAPAVVFLIASGEVVNGVGLGLFCLLVVGSIDNLLRPKLVGSDTQLHELMIFFSTLGGIMLFGFMGFIIGPIVAALFVTVWELYGYEFDEWLPTTAFKPRSGPVKLPHQRLLISEGTSRGNGRHRGAVVDGSDGDEAASVAKGASRANPRSAEAGNNDPGPSPDKQKPRKRRRRRKK